MTASSFTSASTTAAPASANAIAVARPIPLAAPVTSATLPVKSRVFLLTIVSSRADGSESAGVALVARYWRSLLRAANTSFAVVAAEKAFGQPA